MERDGCRPKRGTPKKSRSRVSQAICLGIVTLLTTVCQSGITTSLAIQNPSSRTTNIWRCSSLHSLSARATKFLWKIKSIRHSTLALALYRFQAIILRGNLSTESLFSHQKVLSRPWLPLNSKRLMRLQGTDALPTLISRTNNSYHKMDLNIYKIVNAAANT